MMYVRICMCQSRSGMSLITCTCTAGLAASEMYTDLARGPLHMHIPSCMYIHTLCMSNVYILTCYIHHKNRSLIQPPDMLMLLAGHRVICTGYACASHCIRMCVYTCIIHVVMS